jgi:hypothetical protein
MILFTKQRAKREEAIIARGAIISAQLDEHIDGFRKIVATLAELSENVIKQTELAKKVLESNKEFVEVIRHFFAVEHKTKLEDAQRKAAKEAEFEMTKDDLRY